MSLAPVRGVIERRLLIAYRLDPEVAQDLLPVPFRPRLINGYAVAAVVLARLARLRPVGLPTAVGLAREFAAHAIAAEWRTGQTLRTGAYVLHRDSAADGPRLAPRLRRAAQFTVDERTDGLRITYRSGDRSTQVKVDVSLAAGLTGSALFPDLRAAARFFESDGAGGGAGGPWAPRTRGLRITATDGALSAAHVRTATSSIFADQVTFPPTKLHLDSALLLRDLAVAWAPAAQVRVARRAATSLA